VELNISKTELILAALKKKERPTDIAKKYSVSRAYVSKLNTFSKTDWSKYTKNCVTFKSPLGPKELSKIASNHGFEDRNSFINTAVQRLIDNFEIFDKERENKKLECQKEQLVKQIKLLANYKKNENNRKIGFPREEFYLIYPTREVFKEKFYNTEEWGAISLIVLVRDQYTCQLCGKKPARNVHHLRDAYSFPEMCLFEKNLITLCDDCHNTWHNRK
jgi:hypothetical protein